MWKYCSCVYSVGWVEALLSKRQIICETTHTSTVVDQYLPIVSSLYVLGNDSPIYCIGSVVETVRYRVSSLSK
jgi:hypothetical protein